LRRVDTSPIGFAVFDRVLLTVHPDDCAVREAYADRLLAASHALLEKESASQTSGQAQDAADSR
jgi:hypothetical protein